MQNLIIVIWYFFLGSSECLTLTHAANSGVLLHAADIHILVLKGTVSRDFPAQTAYIIPLQITSLFMDKTDIASFCKLAEKFAILSHPELSRTALSASWPLSGTALSETGRCPGQL